MIEKPVMRCNLTNNKTKQNKTKHRCTNVHIQHKKQNTKKKPSSMNKLMTVDRASTIQNVMPD